MSILPNQLTLALDCSRGNTTVALIFENKVFDFIHQEPCNPSAHLAEFFNTLLKRQNKAVMDINNVLFCHGPGSFTSLRVGLAFLKGFFWGREICFFSVSSDFFNPKDPETFLKIIDDRLYQKQELHNAVVQYH